MKAIPARTGCRVCAPRAARIAFVLLLGGLLAGAAPAADPADDAFLTGDLNAALEDQQNSAATQPDSADFEKWEPILEEDDTSDNLVPWYDSSVKTIDWVRHLGFRHSSTNGRHTEKGVPLEGTSWLNRPYHADWFVGSLLGTSLVAGHVEQDNAVFSGVRIGYDFDYYWGLDWRFGWSNPNIDFATPLPKPGNGSFFITDIDLKYYPWGDSKVRPFYLIGTGFTQVNFIDDSAINHNVTLLTMPLGMGFEFHQMPWLVWRLEVLDNLSFGADDVETLNNFSFTAGMEWRLGARPRSYWPWRASPKVW
jgi:hypothetical protein